MLDQIEIVGYRRLLNTSAYVGRKMVAFVGPNEAGKTSVLSALHFFGSDGELRATDSTRSLRGASLEPSRAVVRLSVTLDDVQRARAKTLPIEDALLRHVIFTKQANGKRTHVFEPRPVLNAAVKEDLAKAWPALDKFLMQVLAEVEEGEESDVDEDQLAAVQSFLEGSAPQPDAGVWDDLLKVIDTYIADDHELRAKADAFRIYHGWASPGVDLGEKVYRELEIRAPMFTQFSEDDRSIRADYVVSDASTDKEVALQNLLRLAGLPLEKIRSAAGDPSYMATLEEQANDRLKAFFTEKWKQEQITVGLKVDGDILRVNVKDIAADAPGWIEITERSDGLRTFVALAAFLDAGDFERPPILLIDEAERHLHQNAQGDLVRMLQDLAAVQQVIYTTHSPACLPADLGNGVRFIEPIRGGHSVIRHDFWSIDRNEHVGFNPLLIVMGAGAAAFSSLRRALIAEGVSDMLLLPTLIKLATGKSELEYQVSPGIATASKTDMTKLDFVASRVAYLVDGDDGGKAWSQQLEEAGAPRNRIKALPSGVGLEDLLDRDFYLDAVAALSGLQRSVLDKARTDVPVKAALAQLKPKSSIPGPVPLAEFILGRHESNEAPIVLNGATKRRLVELDGWALKLLDA